MEVLTRTAWSVSPDSLVGMNSARDSFARRRKFIEPHFTPSRFSAIRPGLDQPGPY
jgi:hypothetical protein